MPIRVLLADDSMVMRLMVKDILEQEKDIQVVASVKNGKEAVVKTCELEPDVVILDMLMGDYDGIYGVKGIMKEMPTPIILLSALGNYNLQPVLDALDLGAFDYVNKPEENNTKIKDVKAELITKVRAASNAEIKKLKREPNAVLGSSNTHPHTFTSNLPYEIIVIGASTGGPTAIQSVITKLPSNLAIPVIIIQHMPDNFIEAFAKRLNELSPINVQIGNNGDIVKAGNIYVIRGGQNTRVVQSGDVVRFERDKKTYTAYNHPSIDGMMISVANIYEKKTIGVVLTGMGKDGAEGIKAIKLKKGLTIAQDEESSVVFGMPKEAINLGFVDGVMDVKDVAGYIISSMA